MPRLKRQESSIIGEQFYEMLPQRWRTHDHSPYQPQGELTRSKFHKRLIRIFGDIYDQKKDEYNLFGKLMDPLHCPSEWLGHLSSTLGLPLDPRIPETTARLLIEHIQEIFRIATTDRAIRLICYALSGISIRIYTPNGSGSVWAQSTTYLKSPYRSGDDHIEVMDPSSFRIGDRISLLDGTRISSSIIRAKLGNNLYLKHDLLFLYKAGVLVTKGKDTRRGFPGVRGENVAIAGSAYPGIQIALQDGRCRYQNPERGNTVYIEWHHLPDEDLLDIISDLIEEFSPGHLHIRHISNEFTYFIAGLSIAGGRENAGG